MLEQRACDSAQNGVEVDKLMSHQPVRSDASYKVGKKHANLE